MSGPVWKVYSAGGVYKAACKDGEDAACLAGLHGPGATIKWNHQVIMWREGQEEWSAEEDYSGTAAVLYDRLRAYHQKKWAAHHERDRVALAAMDQRAQQAERDARAEQEERDS